MKEKKEMEQRKSQGLKNFKNVKAALSTGVFNIFGKAQQVKNRVINDDVKAKVATQLDKVGSSQIGQVVKGGVQVVGTKVKTEVSSTGGKVTQIITKAYKNSGEVDRKNLDQYLQQEKDQ